MRKDGDGNFSPECPRVPEYLPAAEQVRPWNCVSTGLLERTPEDPPGRIPAKLSINNAAVQPAQTLLPSAQQTDHTALSLPSLP